MDALSIGSIALLGLIAAYVTYRMLHPRAPIDPTRLKEPSERVKELAQQGPSEQIEAMRAYRQETGADVREALAVIKSLNPSANPR